MAADEKELRLLVGNLEAVRDGLLDAKTLAEVAEVAVHLDVCVRAALTLLDAREGEDVPPADVVPLFPDGDDCG